MIPSSTDSRAELVLKLRLELGTPLNFQENYNQRNDFQSPREGKHKGNTYTLKKEKGARTRNSSFSLQVVQKVMGFLTDIMGEKGKHLVLPLLLHRLRIKTQCTEGRLGSAASKDQDIS